MALNSTLRPGLIQMRVLDLDKTLTFYKDILGLDEVARTTDGRVLLKGFDEFDHHSVSLRLADEAGVDLVAFKVDSPATLERLKTATEAFGYPVDEVAPNTDQPGFGKRYGFTICTGHRIELYAEVMLSPNGPMTHNPDPWVNAPRGMRAQRFDHCLLYGPNIAEAERYFTEVLGMFAPEVCNTPDGKRFATWLTSGNKPHDLAFVEYEKPGKIHHLGFLLQDWNDIGNAADWMAKYGVKRDVGPTRHAITRGQTIYFWEPSGNRIETYCGGYTAYPDNPQRTWDISEVGKGLFYYEGELIPTFLQVVT
ncbi:catechol 2,3-dioxygenase [Ruminococcaceae bacterium OttesenSCG-928-A16]|nr:catechol 2,3-dioxygenase [Ruminococcaceae bacterium OttesenSCG-928-A16]